MHGDPPDPADFLDPGEVARPSHANDALAEYKEACESCLAPITWVEPASWCSSGCTFCSDCAADLSFTCPDCAGNLVRRPPQARVPGTTLGRRL